MKQPRTPPKVALRELHPLTSAAQRQMLSVAYLTLSVFLVYIF